MPTSAPAPAPAASHAAGRTPRIAIVCRDDEAGEAVTTFIADLGLEPVISQEPSADGSSLEVLEGLRQVDFALVLQTDRRLEIGFLLAVLGRARVFVLESGTAPAGLAGLTHHAMEDSGVWRLLLARAMKQGGLEVDLNRAL
jgi:predicted nucleotide-binding protein